MIDVVAVPLGEDWVRVPADSVLVRALEPADRALRAGDRVQALRELDRVARQHARESPYIASCLGRLLAEAGEFAALPVLRRAAEDGDHPRIEADLIAAQLRFGQRSLAQQRLASAMLRYAIDPDSPLAALARTLMTSGDGPDAAWAAIDSRYRYYAEAPAKDGETLLFSLRRNDGTVLRERETRAVRGRARCTLPLPRRPDMPSLSLSVNGHAIPGGQCALPLDFRADARAHSAGRQIEAWVRLGWLPDQMPTVEISDAYGHKLRIEAEQRGLQGRWHFRCEPQRLGLKGGRYRLAVLLPDGRLQPFADSPLLMPSAARRSLRGLAPRVTPHASAWTPASPPPVDIIIPVFQGRDETLACIAAAVSTAAAHAATILVVNDDSPDEALSAELEQLAQRGTISLLRNARNMGFSASVNRAMAVHPQHDAIILNADAVVFGDWLKRLQRAAYSAPRIGSATPFTDDDSVARYTDGAMQASTVARAAELDAYAALAHAGATARLPVGVGFCMFIRRACWKATGAFDAEAFDKGYGEEADWGMRARHLGWRHVLAADVFVHHAGGRSFGNRRAALMERAAYVLEARHPGYAGSVQRELLKDELLPWRRSFDRQLLQRQSKPIVLLMTLGLPGGVHRFVGERCQQLAREGKLPIMLRPLKYRPGRCVLWSPQLKLQHLRFRIPLELAALRETLAALPIESIEFNHFIGLDSRLVELVLALNKPYDVYLHDYAWVCPRITLVDATRQYCGEPALRQCERCVKQNGSDLMEDIGVRDLRQRSARWLRGARQVFAPSHDLAMRYARHFPERSIEVRPIESEVVVAPRRRREADPAPVRVALIGGIGAHKGYRVLRACVRDALRRKLPLEFVVIGYTEADRPLLDTGKVFVTGPYQDREFDALVRREHPDVIWLPSVWPETWCYTLSHALGTGAPIVAFDIGAIAERLRALRLGRLLPLGTGPGAINDVLIDVALHKEAAESLFADTNSH